MGLATLASIDRLITRGSDRVAGLWAALAFLAGGWPPLVVIGLAIIVIGRTTAKFSLGLVLPPLAQRRLSGRSGQSGLPPPRSGRPSLSTSLDAEARLVARRRKCGARASLEPVRLLLLEPFGARELEAEGRPWLTGWLQVALACFDRAGRSCRVSGRQLGRRAGRPARGARRPVSNRPGLERSHVPSRRAFFIVFWVCARALVGRHALRVLHLEPGDAVLPAAGHHHDASSQLGSRVLGWSALETRNSRRGLVTLMVIAVALKLVHWGYYVPEWNYRYSQGPWGRAIGQWVPKRWAVYTFHDWPPDLAFFIKRPVRQLRSPHYLEYQARPARASLCCFKPRNTRTGPSRPRRSPWSRNFSINRRDERILARTAGSASSSPGPESPDGRSIATRHQRLAADEISNTPLRHCPPTGPRRRYKKICQNLRHFARTSIV